MSGHLDTTSSGLAEARRGQLGVPRTPRRELAPHQRDARHPEAAETAARHDIDPSTDIHASAKYRRQLASVRLPGALVKEMAFTL